MSWLFAFQKSLKFTEVILEIEVRRQTVQMNRDCLKSDFISSKKLIIRHLNYNLDRN